jgi:endonuclease/exonuclease/phosphatase family metal-dependent hydrolase
MVERITQDRPAIVALQELGAGTLGRLTEWSGYSAYGDVSARPRLPHPLGTLITELNPNLFRSAVEGQAVALLIEPAFQVVDHRSIVLNNRRYRTRIAEELGLGFRARLWWARERRVCQALRVQLPDGRTAVVANYHGTGYPDRQLADAELRRAASFAVGLAAPDEPVVLAGDFNLTVATSPTLRELSEPQWEFSPAGPGLDHVLARGLEVTHPERHWPENLRRHDGVLLSDHAPVELEVA